MNTTWVAEKKKYLPGAEEKGLCKKGNDALRIKRGYKLFTKKWLDEIFGEYEKATLEERDLSNFYSTILYALDSLGDFMVFVSLEPRPDIERKKIDPWKEKEWAKIYLASTGDLVLTLSHDPYSKIPSYQMFKREGKGIKEIIKGRNTIKDWKELFHRKMRDSIIAFRVEASVSEKKAKLSREKAGKLEAALPSK